MHTKAARERQANLERVVTYLRQRDTVPSIGEIADEMGLRMTTAATYIQALERTGQITTRKEKRGQWVVKLVELTDWTPEGEGL